MDKLFNAIIPSRHYRTILQREQANLILIAMLVILFFYTVFITLIDYDNFGGITNVTPVGAALINPIFAAPIAVSYGAFILGLIALRGGRLHVAGFMPLIMLYAGSVVLSLITDSLSTTTDALILSAFVLMCGVIQRTQGLLLGTFVAIITLTFGALLNPNYDDSLRLTRIAGGTLVLVGIAAITYMFLRLAQINRSEGAQEATAERLKLAELTTSLGQKVVRRIPLNQVLSELVEDIRHAYPRIYHAQIFVIDETGQEARLVASTGEIGQLLLARKHSLAVGSLSVIGQSMVRRDPVIQLAGEAGSIHRRNELLPDTAVEAAFSLRIGDAIIGALDLQSKDPDAFASTEDVTTYGSLAESIAVAIDNARLFEQTEQRLRENLALVEQMRTSMRDVEQMNERLTGRAWTDYLKTRAEQLNRVVDFSEDGQQVIEDADTWTPTLQEALQHGDVVEDTRSDRHVVAVPLRVRGQVVGAMEFELDRQDFSLDDLSLLQEVSMRFGLAAENTRLLEESQRLAQREALVNEINNRLQSTNNVETTLTEAARSLSDALKAARVSIRLGAPR